MPNLPVGLPFDWHLPPTSAPVLPAEEAAARDVTALHALQLTPHSPYADVHELWAQGQSLDMGAEVARTLCAPASARLSRACLPRGISQGGSPSAVRGARAASGPAAWLRLSVCQAMVRGVQPRQVRLRVQGRGGGGVARAGCGAALPGQRARPVAAGHPPEHPAAGAHAGWHGAGSHVHPPAPAWASSVLYPAWAHSAAAALGREQALPRPAPMPPMRLQEERSEQLGTVAELASLITGFEMIAFLQFEFDATQISRVLQILYAVSSALTVRPGTPAWPQFRRSSSVIAPPAVELATPAHAFPLHMELDIHGRLRRSR